LEYLLSYVIWTGGVLTEWTPIVTNHGRGNYFYFTTIPHGYRTGFGAMSQNSTRPSHVSFLSGWHIYTPVSEIRVPAGDSRCIPGMILPW
jgi:hypothetical protein